MRRHPVYGYELLSPIPYLRPASDIPYCHHEKWDGTGYPRALKGEQIPPVSAHLRRDERVGCAALGPPLPASLA
jgi:response regulator RpfG family c-di-GMP phosphodiesterase